MPDSFIFSKSGDFLQSALLKFCYNRRMPAGKTKPRRDALESRTILRQMQAAYENEHLSLEEVGGRFGITRQAVSDRFQRAGIKAHPPGNRMRAIDPAELKKLYVEQKLTITQTAARLQTNYKNVIATLEKHGIQKRPKYQLLRKYPRLWEIRIGESMTIARPLKINNVYVSFHARAAQIGIRISVRKTGDGFEITRLG